MKQEGNILIADKGKEIYNLERPQVYGKRVKLADGDKASNWGERVETPKPEDEEEMSPDQNIMSKRITMNDTPKKKDNWFIRFIKKLMPSL